MKRLTHKLITSAVHDSLEALFGRDTECIERNLKSIVETIKLGEEAEAHVGYKTLGYFAIECTDLMFYYYEFPRSFHDKWEETMRQCLALHGYYMEPKNHCEYCFYKI